MTQLADVLTAHLAAAFAAEGLDPALGRVVRAQRPDQADFQCNGAMPAAKAVGRKPLDIAVAIAGRIGAQGPIAHIEPAGPGFLNLVVSDAAIAARADAVARDPDRAGAGCVAAPRRIVVDYAGPNVAKPMHVGHLRATIIGDSMKRLMRFRGDTVWGDAHFGDWGFQMGLLIAGVEERLGAPPDEKAWASGAVDYLKRVDALISMEFLQALYPDLAARAKSDDAFRDRARKATAALQKGHAPYRAIWAHMRKVSLDAQKTDFAALGVSFDLWLGESDADPLIDDMVRDLRARGLAVEDGGALVVHVHERLVSKKDGTQGPDIPPLLVVSSEGSAMYGTTDLATILQRKRDFNPDLILYCVDQRQADHFEQVFRAAAKAGYMDRTAMEHIGFGTMNGVDGKPFKTREGGVLKLADLIAMVREKAETRCAEAGIGQDLPVEERRAIADKVGVAALKFADLQNFRGTSYVFDLERFTSFEGKTGPYLLYAVVRIRSILRKARVQKLEGGAIAITTKAERDLALMLDGFDAALAGAYEKRAPHLIAEHAYSLAQAFSAFYGACQILGEPDAQLASSRLSLSIATLNQLSVSLSLLGIESPDKM